MNHLPQQSSSPTLTSAPSSIVIIGAGPRGASLLERLGAHLSDPLSPLHQRRLEIHVVDDTPRGAGRIWRTDQTRELCMNTLADAVTLFTEPGSTVRGAVRPGPTLYEWCVLALTGADAAEAPGDPATRISAVPDAHRAVVRRYPHRPGLAEEYRDELLAMRPESHPSRALYGEYLTWCFDRAVAELPDGVTVVQHRARAIGIANVEEGSGRDLGTDTVSGDAVRLDTGEQLPADAIVLATGWMPRAETSGERELSAVLAARPELTWVRPGSPVEQDLSAIGAREHVIMRGLGMGFFDTMALLTIGRGGRFEAAPDQPGGLRYRFSGREPVMHVTSGRGVPFRAKTLYGSLPPRAEQRFLTGVDWSALPRPIDFDRQLWPRIVADAYFDHARTLRRVRPAAVIVDERELETLIAHAIAPHLGNADDPHPLDTVEASVADAMARVIPDPSDRFDLAGEMHPVRRPFADRESYNDWIAERVVRDLAEAELGHDSAMKAGLWSVSSARGVANRLGALGGFDAESRASGFAMLQAVGGMAGSGPPAFRNRQLLALMRVGLVQMTGPRANLSVTDAGFASESPMVTPSRVTAPHLVDAWMHFHDLSETADPLARSLLDAGRARAFEISARDGSPRCTGAFDLDPATGRLRGADGALDSRVHIAGIPVDEALHDTIISPMPGTDPQMLRETDRVAASLIAVAASVRSKHHASGIADRPLEGAHHD
ncbi:FAD/NAD(P)-binding protein [Leucobacter japonicus]|uniref:FAD/NAD(P)-binding protein n=1 Tax=Leucobacter japonicus TaxID=1461259 RepID=UPI0006A799B4|nr:FAD/NAD(P)-binding protein [Leucobacter japonicus]